MSQSLSFGSGSKELFQCICPQAAGGSTQFSGRRLSGASMSVRSVNNLSKRLHQSRKVLDEKVTQIALSLSYFCNSYKATDLPRRQEKGAEISPSTPKPANLNP